MMENNENERLLGSSDDTTATTMPAYDVPSPSQAASHTQGYYYSANPNVPPSYHGGGQPNSGGTNKNNNMMYPPPGNQGYYYGTGSNGTSLPPATQPTTGTTTVVMTNVNKTMFAFSVIFLIGALACVVIGFALWLSCPKCETIPNCPCYSTIVAGYVMMAIGAAAFVVSCVLYRNRIVHSVAPGPNVVQG